ncbi:hypothetical protein [Nonomuraea sp. NPDC050310]|uniref:hypothetical protein n=1 Tax=Nonomuraea sp. NPDC050310 TaxID=3154935 RepID=UPI0033DA1663
MIKNTNETPDLDICDDDLLCEVCGHQTDLVDHINGKLYYRCLRAGEHMTVVRP